MNLQETFEKLASAPVESFVNKLSCDILVRALEKVASLNIKIATPVTTEFKVLINTLEHTNPQAAAALKKGLARVLTSGQDAMGKAMVGSMQRPVAAMQKAVPTAAKAAKPISPKVMGIASPTSPRGIELATPRGKIIPMEIQRAQQRLMAGRR